MGVINATPDSFSDGGSFIDAEAALLHGLAIAEQGADILDIGGESTRPGAVKVSLQEELDRVIPVIELLSQSSNVPISIDTYKAEVMRAAIQAGASMVNDVNGLQGHGTIDVVAEYQLPVCLMHMQGTPKNMQDAPNYQSVVDEVNGFFDNRVKACSDAGIDVTDIILDPGIGFGKTLRHNFQLLNNIDQIRQRHGCEVLIGVSRKSLIDNFLGRSVSQRLPASLGLAVQAVLNGAKIVRVHDVRETYDAVRMVEAVRNSDT
jgi:dihydropteroate synthase